MENWRLFVLMVEAVMGLLNYLRGIMLRFIITKKNFQRVREWAKPRGWKLLMESLS